MSEAPYVSNYLYHFVGRRDPSHHEHNFSVLCKVLSALEVRHQPFTSSGSAIRITIDPNVSVFSEELMIPTVTCFSDIPRISLGIHTRKYGQFGLSIRKEHLFEQGARRVMYWPYRLNNPRFRNDFLKDVWLSFHDFRRLVVSPKERPSATSRSVATTAKNEEEAIDAFESAVGKELLAYVKPFNVDESDEALGNFYMEREWRHFGYLPFLASDIGEIVVAAEYKERLSAIFPELGKSVREIRSN